MGLTKKQKNLIKKKIKTSSLKRVADELNVKPKEIENYLKKIWRKEKYEKFVNQKEETQSKYINFKNWLKKNWKQLCFLAFLVLAVYFNSLNNEFLSDDIAQMNDITQVNSFKFFWQPPFFQMRSFLIYVIYKIFGLKPIFFRLSNIFFHLGSSWLIYFLVSFLLNHQVALFTAAIFAVHPLQTEAVTWISGGPYSNSAFFALLALVAYIFANQSKKILIFSVFSFFIALTFSEKLVVFSLTFLFYELFWGNLKKNWKKLTPFFLITSLWSFKLLGLVGVRSTILQTEFYQQPGLNNPFIQIPFAITSYLELILWPKNLSFYHSELAMPLPEYIIRLIVFIIFLVFSFWLWKKKRPLFFWVLFFFIPLLPTLTPLRIAWVVAERYVYLAALGIYVIIAYGLYLLGRKISHQKPFYLVLVIILLALSARTIIRNRDWKNQDALWLATAKTSPSSAQNHNNLGDYYLRHGNYEKAIEEFKIAIELQPNYGDAFHNLANVYHQIENDDLAIENYQKALSFNANLWQSHQNLAAIYFAYQNYQMAKEHLLKATEINPDNPIFFHDLGLVYFKLQEIEQARQALQKALQLDPQNEKTKQLLMSLP